MKWFVTVLPFVALTCCSCSKVAVQSLSTRVGETEAQQAIRPTPQPTPTPTPLPSPTAVPTPIPVKPVVAKAIAIPTFALPPLPEGRADDHEFEVFVKGVLKQLEDGKTRVIKSKHKITGEFNNAKDLINDKALLKELIGSALSATDKSIEDCNKLSQYTKNALEAFTAMRVTKESSKTTKTELSLQLPALDSVFSTLASDLTSISNNLRDLAQNADSDDQQYLEDSMQSGSSLLEKVDDDIVDLKSASYNLNAAFHSDRNPGL